MNHKSLLDARGIIYTLKVNEQNPFTSTSYSQISESVDIPSGNYIILTNLIARSNSSSNVYLLLSANGNGFLQSRIPYTNSTHISLAICYAIYLPESTVVLSMKRDSTEGAVVLFSGYVVFVRMR